MNNSKRIITRIAHLAKALFLVVVVAMTCSCDDFLTIYPTDKVVKEDFWKNKTDVESVVFEAYRLMSQPDFTQRLIVWGEVRGDNVTEGNNIGTDLKNILEANILPSNGYVTWSIFYQVINNCNLVLELAPGVLNEDPDFTQGDLDVLCGEMHAVRALCHFYLVRAFRDIPMLKVAMIDNNQPLYQKQVSPIEALDWCLDELRLAEDLVLTSGNYRNETENKGRITKDAVRTMIADVLLWKAAFETYESKGNPKESYDECIEYCDKVLSARMDYIKAKLEKTPGIMYGVVLNDSLPILYPSTKPTMISELVGGKMKQFPHQPYMLQFANGCNSLCESIFEIQHETRKETGNKEVPYFYGCSQDDDGSSFTVGQLSATSYVALSDQKFYGVTDFRRVNYVLSQKDEKGNAPDKYGIIKYGYSSSEEVRDANESSYIASKIKYNYLKTIDDGGRFYKDDIVNWIVYRISDVILMKAEALALRNVSEADVTEAFNLVATVYDRSQTYKVSSLGITGLGSDANALKKPGSASAMVNLVFEERHREFAFEGKRWFDLVRLALLTSKDETTDAMFATTGVIDHKYSSNASQYKARMKKVSSLFFPIAEREINASLEGGENKLIQNEAYNTDDVIGDSELKGK